MKVFPFCIVREPSTNPTSFLKDSLYADMNTTELVLWQLIMYFTYTSVEATGVVTVEVSLVVSVVEPVLDAELVAVDVKEVVPVLD